MELENGKVYRVKDGPVITDIRVLEQNAYAYLVEIVNTTTEVKAEGKKAFLSKTGETIQKVIGELKPDDIFYTPELIDVFIELSLVTNDRELFFEMTNKKKELTKNERLCH